MECELERRLRAASHSQKKEESGRDFSSKGTPTLPGGVGKIYPQEENKPPREKELKEGATVRGCKCSEPVPGNIMTLGRWTESLFTSAISPCPLTFRPSPYQNPARERKPLGSCSLQYKD